MSALKPILGRWLDGTLGESNQSVAVDSAGNIYVFGQSTGNLPSDLGGIVDSKPSTGFGSYLIKYNSSGVVQWGKWVDSTAFDTASSVTVDASGNVFICGVISGNPVGELAAIMGAKPGSNTSAGYLIKYNSSGVPQWGKWIDGSGSETTSSIATDSSGNVYLLGHSSGTAPYVLNAELASLMGTKPAGNTQGIFFIKYNTSGVALWAKWIDSPSPDQGLSVTLDMFDNIYICGYAQGNVVGELASILGSKPNTTTTNSGGILIKYNTSGEPQWGKWLDGSSSETLYSVTTDSLGNIYVVGITSGTFHSELNTVMESKPNTGQAGFLIKYNTSGEPQWGRWMDGAANDTAYSVKTDSSNNVYILGYASQVLQNELQLLMGSKPSTSTVTNDIFLLKYNSSGVVQSGKWIGNPIQDFGFSVVTDSSDNIYIVGSALAEFQPEFATLMGSKPAGYDNNAGYLLKFINIFTPGAPTSLSATPQDSALSVSFSAPSSNGGADITNYEYSLDNSTWTSLSSPTPATFTVSGLTNGTSQTVYIRAVNSVGSGSAASVSGTPTTNNGGGDMSDFVPVPVEVNLNVNVNAQGQIEVFGEGKPIIQEYIIAEKALPVNSLYDAVAAKGLIEIWEPSSAQGDIMASLADSNKTVTGGVDLTGAYKVTSKKLVEGLEALLCDTFNCINAAPFSSYAEIEYTTQRDFGRVALAAYAHALFGHVDATAAITNDKAFVEGMLSINAAGDNETAGGAAARLAAYTKTIGDGTVDPMSFDSSSSSSDANLAIRLVQAIVGKGRNGASLIESSVQAVTDINSDATLANIVRQVVGQDSNRLINVDFNERTKDIRQLLRFYAGDVIYVNITLQVPAVTIGAAYSGSMTGSSIASRFNEKNYTIKITLE